MNIKEILRIIKLLKQAGFGYNGNPNVKMLVGNTYSKEELTLEDLKVSEVGIENSLSVSELFEIYFIIHQLHKVEENWEAAVLYLLRSIKFKPEELPIRQQYLNMFLDVISSFKFQIKDDDRILIFKEFLRFKEYSKMKWGRDSVIFKYSEKIIRELDCEQIEAPSEDIQDFINGWLDVNRRFRPDEQALDYASQLIFKGVFKHG